MFKDLFIRNLEADDYQENFLIAAVVSILVIRLFLKVTGYPQLGGGSFHIAHMLWGGFFMLIAILMLVSFLSRNAMNVASILGGIGFGTFIDELGKFITRDNNYFFQPTFALIYVIFIAIYLFSRFLPKYKSISKKEYLVNAIDMIREAVANDLDVEEEKKAVEYLRRADQNDPIVRSLTHLLAEIEATPAGTPGPMARFRRLLRSVYVKIARWHPIITLVILFLVVQLVANIFFSTYVLLGHKVIAFHEWGETISSLISGAFVLGGIIYLHSSKYMAYRFFRVAILISIFLTEFFVFYETPYLAIVALLINVFMLSVVNYVILIERHHVMG